MASETPGILISPVASRGNYQVFYNSVDMGLVDEVDPTGFALMFDEITTGSTGKKNVLGHRFVGAKGSIKIQFRQITLTMQEALCPWSTGTPVQLTPPLNADMFSYAQPLQLHPTEMGTVTTQDLIFSLAVPIKVPVLKRDGGKDDVLEIEFAIYPSRTAFNTSYGSLAQGNIKGT